MTESDMLDEGIDDGESRFQNIKDKIQKIRRRSSQGEAMARQWSQENKNKVLRYVFSINFLKTLFVLSVIG